MRTLSSKSRPHSVSALPDYQSGTLSESQNHFQQNLDTFYDSLQKVQAQSDTKLGCHLINITEQVSNREDRNSLLQLKVFVSQNHRMVEVGRDCWTSSFPNPLIKHEHIELVAQDCV